ncbi:MAG TPA: hypothetical protein VGF76_16340 [Polyangiaceae bacterium]|jgi:hypothetical protein
MSVTATNYLSSSSIDAWMEQKTDALYGQMRDSMDTSNRRADAENALNDIKAKLLAAKDGGGDAADVRAAINETLAEYKDIPEVAQVLQPLAKTLTDKYVAAANPPAPHPVTNSGGIAHASAPQNIGVWGPPSLQAAPQVKLDSGQIDDMTKSIGDAVDALGKQDQLGLINIQELNSEINQAKQIASALLDASSKSADAIISHIG